MKMEFESAAAAMAHFIDVLLDNPAPAVFNGMYAEIVGAQFVIPSPVKTWIASPKRRFNYRYMTAEALWNVAHRSDIGLLRRYFAGVDQFVADQPLLGGRHLAHWAYGPHLNQQMFHMMDEYDRDPQSRRLNATTKTLVGPVNIGTPPCLTSIQWLVRDGELHQVTTMRSNDVWLGLPLDIFQFSLMQRMAAAQFGLKVGDYIHQAGSMHLYARDVEVARTFVENELHAVITPEPSEGALRTALMGSVLRLVDEHGHKRYEEGENAEFDPDYGTNAQGLKPYAAMLMGDYLNTGSVINALRQTRYGVGW